MQHDLEVEQARLKDILLICGGSGKGNSNLK